MLVVKVEIWPGGSQEDGREIGPMSAANISNCADVSSYEIELSDGQGPLGGMPTVEFQVDGHRRGDGFWPLIHKALTKAVDESLIPVPAKLKAASDPWACSITFNPKCRCPTDTLASCEQSPLNPA
jgi:hypothetical protein